MKTLELKVLKAQNASEPLQILSYHAQALVCVRSPLDPRGGMDIEEMRLSLRVIDALLKAKEGEWVNLEDADMKHLQSKVGAMRWNIASSLLVQFVDDVRNAPDVAPASKPE